MEAVTNLSARHAPAVAAAASRSIRPCMISFYFHPDYSGSAIQALNLSRHLVKLGLQPLIVSANLTGAAPRDEVNGIPLYRLPVMRARELQIPSFSVSLLKFLVSHRHEYDLIHAHGTFQHVAASLAGRWLGRPTLLKVAMANSDIAFERQGRLTGRANRALVRRFDTYIATTPTIVDEFRARGLDPARVRLIPNGVDTDVFAPVAREERPALRRTLGLPDAPLVTYVGVINSRKNVDGMLRMWRTVCDSHPSAHFALVGPIPGQDDPFYRQVTSYVRDAGLGSRVTFAGFRAPVVPYLQASDAFLFASRREGMANSVLEAMSCGIPCLVSQAAGVAAVIRHGENGYALDVDDENGFARVLRGVLEDPVQSASVGAAARRTIENELSIVATAKQYRDLYNQLLG